MSFTLEIKGAIKKLPKFILQINFFFITLSGLRHFIIATMKASWYQIFFRVFNPFLWVILSFFFFSFVELSCIWCWFAFYLYLMFALYGNALLQCSHPFNTPPHLHIPQGTISEMLPALQIYWVQNGRCFLFKFLPPICLFFIWMESSWVRPSLSSLDNDILQILPVDFLCPLCVDYAKAQQLWATCLLFYTVSED